MSHRILLFLVLACAARLPIMGQLAALDGDTVVLLQNPYVEMGVSSCGIYVVADTLPETTPGPLGPYHPRVVGRFGLVSSANGTWTLPDLCGDYFAPGSPEESFGIELDGLPTALVNRSSPCQSALTDVEGRLTGYLDTGSVRVALWEGRTTDPLQRLIVRQATSMGHADRFVTTTVTLCNTRPSPLPGIYYARSVDPDNEWSQTGLFWTYNRVLGQVATEGFASVSARGPTVPCPFAYFSDDPRARVARGLVNDVFSLSSPKDLWEGVNGYSGTVGDSLNQDWPIGIGFFIDTLAPGACTSFRFHLVIGQAEINRFVDSLGACTRPFDLSSEVAATKANLRWDGPSSALGYRLFGGPAGGTPVVRNVAADSIRINGLNPGTTYQWTVRSICGVDTLSDAAPVQFFTTPLLRTAGMLADWSMVPNPASGRVRLQGEDLARAETLELLDPAGRLLRRERLAGADAHELALHGLAPGLYLVVLRGPAGTGHRRLVVE